MTFLGEVLTFSGGVFTNLADVKATLQAIRAAPECALCPDQIGHFCEKSVDVPRSGLFEVVSILAIQLAPNFNRRDPVAFYRLHISVCSLRPPKTPLLNRPVLPICRDLTTDKIGYGYRRTQPLPMPALIVRQEMATLLLHGASPSITRFRGALHSHGSAPPTFQAARQYPPKSAYQNKNRVLPAASP